MALGAKGKSRGGVFETIRVQNGEPLRLERHLSRLSRSVHTLYTAVLPADLEQDIRRRARLEMHPAALRVSAAPSQPCHVDLVLDVRPLQTREAPVRLSPVTVPGGIGGHKWRDRAALDLLGSMQDTPLIVDSDGCVLEAGWANIFVVHNYEWVTPPTDGRILPGVTRDALIAALGRAGVPLTTRDLSLVDVASADAILLTSALTIVTWAAVPDWAGHADTATGLATRFRRALLDHGGDDVPTDRPPTSDESAPQPLVPRV
jgi:para-aminobenzoate synthetase/4-amino-4-deoxychorismate lyase